MQARAGRVERGARALPRPSPARRPRARAHRPRTPRPPRPRPARPRAARASGRTRSSRPSRSRSRCPPASPRGRPRRRSRPSPGAWRARRHGRACARGMRWSAGTARCTIRRCGPRRRSPAISFSSTTIRSAGSRSLQVPGGPQSGQAAADDRDVGIRVPSSGRPRREGVRRRASESCQNDRSR